MHFLIYTNKNKDIDLKVTKKIVSYLNSKNVSTTIYSQYERTTSLKNSFDEKIDVVIVLGGDGTVLSAARTVKELDVPIIGVKMGTLGYLTELEPDCLCEALDRLIEGNYVINSRMMLEGRILTAKNIDENEDFNRSLFNGENISDIKLPKEFETGIVDYSLNDIVITRNGPLQIMKFGVYVNGHFLTDYNGDGIIISTPTGSTGYNLSAGGPIIEPSAKLITITPICSHTLNQRSVVLSPEDVIEVVISKGHEGRVQNALVNFDGTDHFEVHTKDRLIVKAADITTKFINLSQINFLENLCNKLSGQ